MRRGIEKVVTLDLETPVAAVGRAGQVWVADKASKSVKKYDAGSGAEVDALLLDVTPMELAVGPDLMAIASEEGYLLWYSIASGQEVVRRSMPSLHCSLKSDGGLLWLHDRESSRLMAFDQTERVRELDVESLKDFTVGGGRVYWSTYEAVLSSHDLRTDVRREMKGRGAGRTGALSFCANSLWMSVADGLMMVSATSLEYMATLKAPEGPVPHLICNDGAIIGAKSGMFILDPASDDSMRSIALVRKNELRALVGAGTHVWALESGEPLVHIIQIH